MNIKKIVIALLLIVLVVSDLLIMFAQKYIGEYTSLFAMISIFSGLALIIMIIINRKRSVVSTKEVKKEYDVLSEEKKEVKICYICKYKNKIKASYCVKCGSDLKDIVCPICNTVNPFDQKYCVNCDTILQNKKRHI